MPPEPAGTPPVRLDEAGIPGASVKPVTGFRPLLWWLVATIVGADQVTKWLVQHHIPVFDSVTIIPGLMEFVHIHNRGVAFGLMNDATHPAAGLLPLLLALAALAAILYYARQVQPGERLARTGLSLVLGGAIGNLIDRARLGHVVDFIDVYRGDWHFWAFNVADAAISCGAVLIFIELLFPGRHASHSV